MDSWVVIVGLNGVGKLMFLKFFEGDILFIKGWINCYIKFRLARFF